MTLEEAVALLQDSLPDYTGVVHRPADLENLLEQGANMVAALTLAYERTVTFRHTDSPQVIVPHSREYRISGPVGELGLGLTDSLKLLHVHLNGVLLPQITVDQYSAIDPVLAFPGTPRYWYEFAGYLGWLPYPGVGSVASPYELEITYAATVGSWTAHASGLPMGVDELPTGYAYVKAKMREGLWRDAVSAFNAWFDQVQVQVAILQRPVTQKADLRLPVTEARRRDGNRRRRAS